MQCPIFHGRICNECNLFWPSCCGPFANRIAKRRERERKSQFAVQNSLNAICSLFLLEKYFQQKNRSDSKVKFPWQRSFIICQLWEVFRIATIQQHILPRQKSHNSACHNLHTTHNSQRSLSFAHFIMMPTFYEC